MTVLDKKVTEIFKWRLLGVNEAELLSRLNLTLPELAAHDKSTKGAIQRAVSEGATELEDIAERLQLAEPFVIVAFFHYRMELPFEIKPKRYIKGRSKAQKIEDVQVAQAYGVLSVEAIAEITQIRKSEVCSLLTAPNPAVVIDYKTSLEDLTHFETGAGESMAERWAYEKTMQYARSPNRDLTSFYQGKVFTLFKRLEDAKRKGAEISLKELGKPLGMPVELVSYIFNQVGIDPKDPYGKKINVDFLNKRKV